MKASDIRMVVFVDNEAFETFEAAADSVVRQLGEGGERATRRINAEMVKSLQRVAQQLEARHSRKWDGSVAHSNPNLFKRSGRGLNELKDSIRRVNNMAVFELRGHMAFHEDGGTISARKSKYLTIPLPAAMDSRGVPIKRSAREWSNTFVKRSRAGNLIIFQRRGRSIVPLYILKPSVYIRPRLGAEKAFLDEMPYFQERALDILTQELVRHKAGSVSRRARRAIGGTLSSIRGVFGI